MDKGRLRRTKLILACAAGLAINTLVFKPGWGYDANRDFLGLYPGGRLAGSARLYDAQSVLAEQDKAVGFTNPQRLFVRLPFYAVFLWPIARLPYRTAFAVFQIVMVAATIGFIWLWRIPNRAGVLLACCWSMPLMGSFAIAQDLPLLLCVIAGSYVLLKRNHDFGAGMLFGLCAIKPHLFLPVPIFVVAQKKWTFGAGLICGAAILIALSFAAAGSHWLPHFVHAAMATATNPRTELMTNLKGLFAGKATLEYAAAGAVLVALWFIARRSNLEWPFAATLAVGLLTSHHAYVEDCAILLPALLIVLQQSHRNWHRLLALWLLSPLAYLWLFLGAGVITRLSLVLFALSFATVSDRPVCVRYS